MKRRIFKKATKELNKLENKATSLGLQGLISFYFNMHNVNYCKTPKETKREKRLDKCHLRIKNYRKILKTEKRTLEITRIDYEM